MNRAGRVLLRRLTHNVGWKLASLGVAVLLWLAVEGQPELVTVQQIPILYRGLPDGLVLGADAPGEVKAELRGPAGKLNQAALSEVYVAVNLEDVAAPGQQTFTLSNSDFSLPQGVTFLRAVPSQVQLSFDRIRSREVPVELRLTGQVPHGYRLARQEVSPARLRITGPERRINAVESAETDPIDLTSLVETTQLAVNAFIPDPRVQFETPPEPVVTVTLFIEKTAKAR
jgi:hypothetical protein